MKRIYHSRHQSQGTILPTVVMLLVVLGIMTFSLVQHFSHTNKSEASHFALKNQLLAGAKAGIGRALVDIKNPVDDTTSHAWTAGTNTSFTLDIGDQHVTVTEEHVEIPL